ncbi:HIT family protein [Mucisphaera calidilacus]|uniref:AP-4-A phosphorylase n=1 Tax=Mucisphaera calidilacus TaxID=2527982 RepID=A0A518BX60_9BACT|nr:HIT domain-containing protein [Mucisphaera calidilacus]QDU71567.1 AP-4-A phosphorylase [Mucisphaera calidilacus]
MSGDKKLWAPWRIEYLRGELSSGADDGCFLCEAGAEGLSDQERRERLILTRYRTAVVLMNRYPYTNGHLLVASVRHVGELGDLTVAERADLMELVAWADALIRRAVCAQGVNIGMNIGRCAGAAVPGHLHVHVVPRWQGDVNFMETVGNARVMPQALEASYADLLTAKEQAGPVGPA